MRDEGIINAAQASEAQAYPLQACDDASKSGEVAPYFVEWIRQQLDEKFGAQLYEQGLKVYTTLDLDMQTSAERALERQIRAIEAGRFGTFPHVTYERYIARSSDNNQNNSANSPYLQGAFIAMDPQTGGGSRARRRSRLRRQQVRSRGAVGAAAGLDVQAVRLRRRHSERTPAVVSARRFAADRAVGRKPAWTPRNFEGDFAGKLPMRRALYQSRNIPTIKLGLELGTQSVIDEARKFGLTTPIPGVSVDLHRRGRRLSRSRWLPRTRRSPRSARVRSRWRSRASRDSKGTVFWEPQPTRVPVLSPEEAWLMVSVMKDVVQRGTAAGSVGAQISFSGGREDRHDERRNRRLVHRLHSDLVAGVWMGFDKPQKIKANAQGGILAAPAWTAFMNENYRRKPAPRDWPMPPDIVTRQIDVTTNMLATPYCPSTVVGERVLHSRHGSDAAVRRPQRAPRCIRTRRGSAVSFRSIPRGAFATVRSLRFRPAIPRRKCRAVIRSVRRKFRPTRYAVVHGAESARASARSQPGASS